MSDERFGTTTEQRELSAVVSRMLRERSPESEVRRIMATESGHDLALWKELAQIGLLALAVPEDLGGAGCGLTEVGVVAEQAGAALLCAPWFSTAVLATQVLLRSSDRTAQEAYLPSIASGDAVATATLCEDLFARGEHAPHAERAGGAWHVSGRYDFVTDALSADLFLVLAGTTDGPTVFAVDAHASGMSIERRPTLDMTRKIGRVEMRAAPARPVGGIGTGFDLAMRVRDDAAAVLAMEQVGAAQHLLDITVDYAKVRYQFGRPIGAFQAIKHRCATMVADVECARSTARWALWAADHDESELPLAASLAKSCCSEAFMSIAGEAIQIHGGIGFTWEHPAHLYFKRARADMSLLGSPRAHRARLADLLGVN